MRTTFARLVLFAPLVLLCGTAAAYIGPGAGLGAIGTVAALAAVIVVALVAFLWYPIKLLRARLRGNREAEPDGETTAGRRDRRIDSGE